MSVIKTNWEKVGGSGEGTVWKPMVVGDAVEGRYVKKEVSVGANKSNMYSLEQNDGEIIKVWGSTVIDGAFDNISSGLMVRIEYLGEETGKNNRKYKNYDIYKGIVTPSEDL